MNHDHGHDPDHDNGMKSRIKWAFIGFAAIAAYFLIAEHTAHLTGWLANYGIWLVLLACPLMHLFMHHDHGGGEHPSRNDKQKEKK